MKVIKALQFVHHVQIEVQRLDFVMIHVQKIIGVLMSVMILIIHFLLTMIQKILLKFQ